MRQIDIACRGQRHIGAGGGDRARIDAGARGAVARRDRDGAACPAGHGQRARGRAAGGRKDQRLRSRTRGAVIGDVGGNGDVAQIDRRGCAVRGHVRRGQRVVRPDCQRMQRGDVRGARRGNVVQCGGHARLRAKDRRRLRHGGGAHRMDRAARGDMAGQCRQFGRADPGQVGRGVDNARKRHRQPGIAAGLRGQDVFGLLRGHRRGDVERGYAMQRQRVARCGQLRVKLRGGIGDLIDRRDNTAGFVRLDRFGLRRGGGGAGYMDAGCGPQITKRALPQNMRGGVGNVEHHRRRKAVQRNRLRGGRMIVGGNRPARGQIGHQRLQRSRIDRADQRRRIVADPADRGRTGGGDRGNLLRLHHGGRTRCGDGLRCVAGAKAGRGGGNVRRGVGHAIDHGRRKVRQQRAIGGIGRGRRGNRGALGQIALQTRQNRIACDRQIVRGVRQADKQRGRIGRDNIDRLLHRRRGGDRYCLHTGKAQLRAAARNHRVEIGRSVRNQRNRCGHRACFVMLDRVGLRRRGRAGDRNRVGIGDIAGRTLAEDGRGAVGQAERHRMGQILQLRQRKRVGRIRSIERGDRAGHIVQHGVRSAQNGRGGIGDRRDRQRTPTDCAIKRGRIGNISRIVRSDRLAAKVREYRQQVGG